MHAIQYCKLYDDTLVLCTLMSRSSSHMPFFVTLPFCFFLVQNLFDDMESNWTLSRPIFGILICHPDSLNFYKQRLLSAQTLPTVSQSELAAKIQAASERLMAGLSQKFSHTNKEKFSSNLVEFRENITQFCTRPM